MRTGAVVRFAVAVIWPSLVLLVACAQDIQCDPSSPNAADCEQAKQELVQRQQDANEAAKQAVQQEAQKQASNALEQFTSNVENWLLSHLPLVGKSPTQNQPLVVGSPLQLPVGGNAEITGRLPGEDDHSGRDQFAADVVSDDPSVYPVADGVVAYAGWNCQRSNPAKQPTCYGYTVAIDHGPSPSGGALYSIYAHLECQSLPGATQSFCATESSQTSPDNVELAAARGRSVGPDTPIGKIGHSGCFDACGSPEEHLHFAVHRGSSGLVGNLALYDRSLKPVDIWDPSSKEHIPGLPFPPAKGRVGE